MGNNCIFCKIVNEEIFSYKIYEDEHTLVFMDIAKDVDGHMLAIPKKHVKNILDCDSETLKHLMETVKKISNHCVEKCGYNGINILNASGASAGQSVNHFHIHIVPRKDNDDNDYWPVYNGAKYEIEEMYEILKIE